MSGRASARCNGSGILKPIAGTTTQSGARFATGRTGTVKPSDVLTVLRTPTTETSKRDDERPDRSASSLAVWKASRTVARPVSKTFSNASTDTLMARTISTMAFLSIARWALSGYLLIQTMAPCRSPRIKEKRYEARIVRPPRSQTRQGAGGRRLPAPGPRPRQPGSDHADVVRPARRTHHIRDLRRVR